jgi:hypothetical protein
MAVGFFPNRLNSVFLSFLDSLFEVLNDFGSRVIELEGFDSGVNNSLDLGGLIDCVLDNDGVSRLVVLDDRHLVNDHRPVVFILEDDHFLYFIFFGFVLNLILGTF